MNSVDLFDLSDKLFPIIISHSALLWTDARHVCLFLDIVGIIPSSV